jgi:hypothetical protein
MLILTTIEVRKLMRKTLICMLMFAVVGFAIASKGGGGDNKKAAIPLKTNFVPIRTTNGFTLKAGPSYSGSMIVGAEKTREYVSFNTLVTYQKGNSFYIMPHTYRINTSVYMRNNTGSNLSLLDLRINMH